MAHPELAHVLLRGRKSQVVLHHGVTKEGGVEVDAKIIFLGKLNPLVEVAGLKLIPVHLLTVFKDGVAGMKADPLFPGHQAYSL